MTSPAMRERILAAGREVARDPQEITFVYDLEVSVAERQAHESSLCRALRRPSRGSPSAFSRWASPP
jgi:hypothetical protein